MKVQFDTDTNKLLLSIASLTTNGGITTKITGKADQRE